MAEGQLLFILDYDRFDKIRQEDNLFGLRGEFDTKNAPLSLSLLISPEAGAKISWLLADFGNKKTYKVKKENETTVEILEGIDIKQRTDILTDAGIMLPRLQEGVGTHIGFIDALRMLDFNIVDLENLKRSDLSHRKLSFESVYPDLEVAYEMLREILTSSRESLISLPSTNIRQLKDYILQFYDMTGKIMGFAIDAADTREQHTNLLQEIHQFCENVKQSLLQTGSYLSSRTVEQLVTQVNTTLTDAEEKFNTTLNTETEKLQKFGEEALQKEEKRQESFDQLYIQLQNQLTEKPISQYKIIFETQAKNHQENARFWMIMAVVATAAFGGVFILLSVLLGSGGTQLTGILQNIFTKGFVLSPIYVWLNRSIKNYTAQKHLEIINTHRQNALETFDTFVEAAEGNRETRDEVLKAATRAIFDANQSGYLSTKTSGSDNTSPVQQIIREVIPTKSSDN